MLGRAAHDFLVVLAVSAALCAGLCFVRWLWDERRRRVELGDGLDAEDAATSADSERAMLLRPTGAGRTLACRGCGAWGSMDEDSEEDMEVELSNRSGTMGGALASLKAWGSSMKASLAQPDSFAGPGDGNQGLSASTRSGASSTRRSTDNEDSLYELDAPDASDDEACLGLLGGDTRKSGAHPPSLAAELAASAPRNSGRIGLDSRAPFSPVRWSPSRARSNRGSDEMDAEDLEAMEAIMKLRPALSDSVGDLDADEDMSERPLIDSERMRALARD